MKVLSKKNSIFHQFAKVKVSRYTVYTKITVPVDLQATMLHTTCKYMYTLPDIELFGWLWFYVGGTGWLDSGDCSCYLLLDLLWKRKDTNPPWCSVYRYCHGDEMEFFFVIWRVKGWCVRTCVQNRHIIIPWGFAPQLQGDFIGLNGCPWTTDTPVNLLIRTPWLSWAWDLLITITWAWIVN